MLNGTNTGRACMSGAYCKNRPIITTMTGKALLIQHGPWHRMLTIKGLAMRSEFAANNALARNADTLRIGKHALAPYRPAYRAPVQRGFLARLFALIF